MMAFQWVLPLYVGMAGCISFGKKKKRAKSQPVYKSESGVPFNDTNLDSARGGPQEGGTPKHVVAPVSIEEPDHAPPGLLNLNGLSSVDLHCLLKFRDMLLHTEAEASAADSLYSAALSYVHTHVHLLLRGVKSEVQFREDSVELVQG